MVKSLDDVCLRLAEYWPPVDREIADLVKAINIYGNWVYHTTMSCSGHIDKQEERRDSPDLYIECNEQLYKNWDNNYSLIYEHQKRFDEVIESFNSQSTIKWKLDWSGPAEAHLTTTEYAESKGQLRRLQQNSKELARFVFDKAIKEGIEIPEFVYLTGDGRIDFNTYSQKKTSMLPLLFAFAKMIFEDYMADRHMRRDTKGSI